MKTKKCSHCGSDNPMDAVWCIQCGTAFRNMSPAKEANKEEPCGKKRSAPLLIAVLAAVAVIIILLIIILPAKAKSAQAEVPCAHNWVLVDCTSPRICSECGKTGSTAAGHTWQEATCLKPKLCAECGASEGSAAGHIWVDATCLKPKHCTVCDTSEGDIADHIWEAATCEHPETCVTCGEVSGAALGHTWKSATFLAPKICLRCDLTDGSPISYTNIDVESEVVTIRYIYNEIVSDIEDGTLRKEYIADGVVGYFDSGGYARCIVVSRNTDGIGPESSKYSRSYYFNGDELIFAYYEGADSHRLYFYDGLLMRWLYRSNAADYETSEYYDFFFTNRYFEFESYAQDECRMYR